MVAQNRLSCKKENRSVKYEFSILIAFDLNKWLKQIKLLNTLHKCVPYPEIPSIIYKYHALIQQYTQGVFPYMWVLKNFVTYIFLDVVKLYTTLRIHIIIIVCNCHLMQDLFLFLLLSFSLSLSLCICIFLSLCLSLYPFLALAGCLSVSPCLLRSLCAYFCLCLCVLNQYICISVYLFLFISLFCMSLHLSFSLFLFLYKYLYKHKSIFNLCKFWSLV